MKPMPPHPKGSVQIKFAVGAPNFHYQFAFNSFYIEKKENGFLVRIAHLDKRGIPLEVADILISTEGLLQMKEASGEYVKSFGEVKPRPEVAIPDSGQAPLFANYIRLAMAGHTGEFAVYTVLLQDIGAAARSKASSSESVNLVQIGLFHSDLNLHKQLVLALMSVV